MKEKRVTKRAIFASLLSVAVCTSMLIGTSYAWFTDSVTSANNKIKSGTLEVDLEVKGGNTGYKEYTSVKKSQAPIFNYDKWEPGYTSWTNVRVTNLGNLALKYTLRFISDDGLLANADLAKVIDVYYVAKEEVTATTRPVDLTVGGKLKKIGTLADVLSAKAGTVLDDFLLPDDPTTTTVNEGQDVATIVLQMQETAGNEYQNKELPSFDLQLIAMQYAYEKDTFDEHYDDKANGIPDHPEWGKLDTSASAKKAASGDTTIEATGATVTIPETDTGTEYTFSVRPSDTGAVTINLGQSQVVYDITLTGADTSTEKVVTLNVGKGMTGLKVYHYGTEMDAAKYSYDATTGILTIRSAEFSPFAIVWDTVAGLRAVESAEDLKAALLDENVTEIDVSGENLQVLDATSIEKPVTISNAVFDTSESSANVNLYQVDFKDDVTFDNCEFASDYGIYNNKFEGDVTFDNCKMNTSVYGIYNNAVYGDVTFKDCTMKSDWCYTINFQGGAGSNTVTIENCDITGWCSFGNDGVGKLVVKDTIFRGGADYNCLRIYQDAEFTNCVFMDNFGWKTDDIVRAIDACANNITITLTNTAIDANKLTTNGAKTGVKFIVDGVEVTPVQGS